MASTIKERASVESKVDVDLFRETPVRYLGYANEIGEAFRPNFPKFVVPSYGIAFAYVAADAMDKTLKTVKNGENANTVIRTGVDALLWQTLASVLIPGKIIHLITAQSVNMFKSEKYATIRALPKLVRHWSPAMIGLLTIPLIIHPIDNAVDYVFDHTLRKWWT